MASWDYSSLGQSHESSEPPPPGKEQEQEARNIFDIFSDVQPRPPGEEDIDLPSLQYSSPFHTNPISNFPAISSYSNTRMR